jgi:hypothetical protein
MWNLIHYIFEDDSDLRSSFSWDFPHLAQFIHIPASRVVIYYRSKKIHGEFKYVIENGKIDVTPLHKIQEDEPFINDIINITREQYDPHAQNAIFFSAHCYKQYIRPFSRNISFQTWVNMCVSSGFKWEFILMDCCYMSTINSMVQFYPVTRYLVGCQSSSPFLGFNARETPELFRSHNTRHIACQMVELFIRRNNTTPFAKIKFYTDGVVLDLKYLPQLLRLSQDITFSRTRSTRVEPDPEYSDLFDFMECLRHSLKSQPHRYDAIKNIISRIVICYRQSNRLKKKYWSRRLHGISIIIGRNSQCGVGIAKKNRE